jgi:hypothetical protein
VLLCRSLGLDTRVVLNFDISPLKPTNEDLAAALGSAKLTNKAVASSLGSVKTEESTGSQKGANVFLHFFCLGERLISATPFVYCGTGLSALKELITHNTRFSSNWARLPHSDSHSK